MATNINTTTGDAVEQKPKSITRTLATVARILMGLIFLIFGSNLFLNFIPRPPTPMPAGAMDLLGAFMKSGYMMSLVGATQVIVGVLLLVNRFVPLALALIAPVIVNIILFHSFLQPAGIGPGLVVTVLEIYLVWSYRASFAPMLASRAQSA